MYKSPRKVQRFHYSTPYCLTTMRSILAAVIMLQALTTGDCLLCEQCLATNTTSCAGILKQCSPDVTHCVKGLENNTLGSDVALTVFKGCLDPSNKQTCNREFSFRNSVLSFQISRTCCDSDFCNRGDVQVPAVDKATSGYNCEECFDDQSVDPCAVTGEVQCTGEHNTCATFKGTAARPGDAVRQFSMKGCASQDFCNNFYLAGTQVYSYDFLCSPAKKV
ncbi:phospholipase A2 inhibitor gamma subunit B-like isoform X2 [Pleurodeles waltl]|uniref:phospholipase A2 inhibitor gamma subunit B-like isoform X2 n=1 Tax=Pleurodeles waltl TaxID=8319 RepID=UPI003709A989